MVLSPHSREMDNPPPSYEDVASGYQTEQVGMPPPYASVQIQAGNDNVKSLGVQEGQPQTFQLTGYLAIENLHIPSRFEDVASDYQTTPSASVEVQGGR